MRIFSLPAGRALATIALALTLAACGTPADETGTPTIEQELCEHMDEGPGVLAQAVDRTQGTPPDASQSHSRYDISLTDVSGGKGGAVRYASAAAGDYVIGLDRDVPLAIYSAQGDPVTPEEQRTGSEVCPGLIAVRHTVDLGVGTYTLDFGPTTTTTVRMVVFSDAAHDDHDATP